MNAGRLRLGVRQIERAKDAGMVRGFGVRDEVGVGIAYDREGRAISEGELWRRRWWSRRATVVLIGIVASMCPWWARIGAGGVAVGSPG